MTQDDIELRPAVAGDGQAVFDVTRRAVAGLASGHYSPEQISDWMGQRTAAFYEALITKGRMVVAEASGVILGFVDAEPGEVTRLFVLPSAAGLGLGRRLLAIGIRRASEDHAGPIKLEATINAEPFYQRHGFVALRRGQFSHGLGGVPIEIVHMELHDAIVAADPAGPSSRLA